MKGGLERTALPVKPGVDFDGLIFIQVHRLRMTNQSWLFSRRGPRATHNGQCLYRLFAADAISILKNETKDINQLQDLPGAGDSKARLDEVWRRNIKKTAAVV